MMHDREKSHSAIVAAKPTNKAGATSVADAAEPRAGTKRNVEEQSTHRTLGWVRVTQALDRVRQACVLPSNTRGKNRMPELGLSGSARGAVSNRRSYRDPVQPQHQIMRNVESGCPFISSPCSKMQVPGPAPFRRGSCA